MHLNNISIHDFTTRSLSISRYYKAPSATAIVSNAPARGRASIELFPQKRKRDIFYSHTLTWKGTFIFADRLGPRGVAFSVYLYRLQNSLAGISMPCSWVRFTGPGFEASYNMNIVHTLKESLLSLASRVAPVVLSNFSYSSSNHPARDLAQVTLNRTRNSHLTANLLSILRAFITLQLMSNGKFEC